MAAAAPTILAEAACTAMHAKSPLHGSACLQVESKTHAQIPQNAPENAPEPLQKILNTQQGSLPDSVYRVAAEGAAAVGAMLIIVCAVALVVRKTNLVTSLKDRWQAQPYEAVGDTGKAAAAGSISLSDVRIDNEAVSDAASSTRSRSPGRTLA